jgi:cytochrome c
MRKASLLFILAAATLLALRSAASAGTGQLTASPGSVVRGERVLSTNGCLNCHALNGKGGTRAPDLAIPSKTAATPALFATSLWNHAPAMLAEFERSNTPAPALKPTDAADLFTYFYATLYFSPRGNAARGAAVFSEKQCSSCHSEILDTQSRKSFVETWMDLKDPSIWAERMWNHASEMDSATSNRGIRWPVLSDEDVVDLVTFLSTRAGTQPEAHSFTIGEPELGQAVFEESCASCHSLGRREPSKVDLLSRRGPSSVTGYIAAMWNHVPAMRKKTGSTPKLKAGQMPDLIAYLFAQRYFFEAGDPGRGKKIFETRTCATCHQDRRNVTGAPDLSKSVETFSPIILTAAAWQHGSSMIKAMKQQGLDWPEFKGREMADLIAYLNSIRIVRVAR